MGLPFLLLLFCGGDDCYAYYDVLVAAGSQHTWNTLRVSYGTMGGTSRSLAGTAPGGPGGGESCRRHVTSAPGFGLQVGAMDHVTMTTLPRRRLPSRPTASRAALKAD